MAKECEFIIVIDKNDLVDDKLIKILGNEIIEYIKSSNNMNILRITCNLKDNYDYAGLPIFSSFNDFSKCIEDNTIDKIIKATLYQHVVPKRIEPGLKIRYE